MKIQIQQLLQWWETFSLSLDIHWRYKNQTILVFESSNIGWLSNGLVLEWFRLFRCNLIPLKNGQIRLVFKYFGIQMFGLIHRSTDDVHVDQPFQTKPFKKSTSKMSSFQMFPVFKETDLFYWKHGYRTIMSFFQVMIKIR